MLISKLKFPVVFLMFVIFFGSCVSNKESVYVQPDKAGAGRPDFQPYIKSKRTIKPGDELYIRVKSDEDETANVNLYRDDAYLASTDITLLTYTVDEKGYLKYPNAGEIQVANLTVEQAAKMIEKGLIGFLTNPSVTVKFTLKNVTVLGEVARPGRYYFDEQEINIFQALGYAGDVTYYGNRQRVMVMREDNNIITKNYLDLTNESLIESYYFYIKPNDVIYVEPLKKRKWGMQAFPFSILLSTLSTLVIILTYVQLYGNR